MSLTGLNPFACIYIVIHFTWGLVCLEKEKYHIYNPQFIHHSTCCKMSPRACSTKVMFSWYWHMHTLWGISLLKSTVSGRQALKLVSLIQSSDILQITVWVALVLSWAGTGSAPAPSVHFWQHWCSPYDLVPSSSCQSRGRNHGHILGYRLLSCS